MIAFAAAWVLWLAPLPLLVRSLAPAHQPREDAVYGPFVARLAEAIGVDPAQGREVARRRLVQSLAFVLAWLLSLACLARPQWIGQPIERTLATRDLLLAVDLSGSMEAADFALPSGERVDRLTGVKLVLDDFLERREGDRVGLILFGSAAFVQAPFTEDLEVCRLLLDEAQVRMAGPRTVIGDAIGLAIHVFEESELDERVLIVLTDGNDTGSRVPPDKAAGIAKDRGIVIHSVAIGDPRSVGEEALDETTLRTMATTTGGTYARANDLEELEAVYERLDELDTRDVQTQSYRPRTELYPWPLGALLALSALFFGFGHVPAYLRERRRA